MAYVSSLALLSVNVLLLITVALVLLVLLDITFIMEPVPLIVLPSINAQPKMLNANVPIV